MARPFDLASQAEDVSKMLARSFQSGHINFLIGSGASFPAIPSAGNVEKEIAALFEAGDGQPPTSRSMTFCSQFSFRPTSSLRARRTPTTI